MGNNIWSISGFLLSYFSDESFNVTGNLKYVESVFS